MTSTSSPPQAVIPPNAVILSAAKNPCIGTCTLPFFGLPHTPGTNGDH